LARLGAHLQALALTSFAVATIGDTTASGRYLVERILQSCPCVVEVPTKHVGI